MKTTLFNNPITWIVLNVLLVCLILQQCNKTKEANMRRAETERIAEQNLHGMNDSTVQLKLTKQQLKYSDSVLFAYTKQADSIIHSLAGKKSQIKEVIVVKPVIVQRDVDVINTATPDSSETDKWDLNFAVNDSIKSFTGTSSFYVHNSDGTLSIVADSTFIRQFKLNFHFSVIKFDDAIQKVTKYKIVPYYTDSTGKEYLLSENQIKFSFRGVDLLDKPWSDNKSELTQTNKKIRLTGRWGLGLNPIGMGPVISNGTLRLGYAPSVSFGYFLTFEKR